MKEYLASALRLFTAGATLCVVVSTVVPVSRAWARPSGQRPRHTPSPTPTPVASKTPTPAPTPTPIATPTPACASNGALYVDLSGSDTTGNGSVQFPYRTVAKAISMVAPGDTISVNAGTYPEIAVF